MIGKKLLEYIQKKFSSIDFTNDKNRVHYQFLFVYGLLALVAYFMTFMNMITGWQSLAQSTFVYGLLCTVSFCIEYFINDNTITSRVFFVVSTIITFTAFAIVGEPEGFSVLWCLLLPTCGFFLFRIKYGLIIVLTQFVIIATLFWTSFGQRFLPEGIYTETFKQRFPVIYISFLFIGLMFEIVRNNTQKELSDTRKEFERLYNRDMLTGIYNRYGFNSTMDEFVAKRNGKAFAFGIIDLDHFKNINDTYGHQKGDIVLKEVANRLLKLIREEDICCRWGGEEFSVLFGSNKDVIQRCENILTFFREHPIDIGEKKITVNLSMGLIFVGEDQEINIATLVTTADANLYEAKENGRDQIVYTIYK